MEKTKVDKLFEVYCNITIANKIAKTTLEELANKEDRKMYYIILGVISQLTNIEKSLDMFNDTMALKGGAANE